MDLGVSLEKGLPNDEEDSNEGNEGDESKDGKKGVPQYLEIDQSGKVILD